MVCMGVVGGRKGRGNDVILFSLKKKIQRLQVGTIAFYILYKTILYFQNTLIIIIFEIYKQNISLGSNENIPKYSFQVEKNFRFNNLF